MSRVTVVLWAVVALLVVLLAGYLWGAAVRWARASELDRSRVQARVNQARADVLQARVDLFEVNFGRASQHVESAKHGKRAAALANAPRCPEDCARAAL
jgi:hypothetical protein